MDEAVLLYTTWPDAETAQACADALVEARLAACANILAPLRSIYWWEGRLESAVEMPVLFKTTRACADAARDLIVQRHPYQTPCVIALAVEPAASNAAYLAWLTAETRAP